MVTASPPYTRIATSDVKRGEKEVTGSLNRNPSEQEPMSNESEGVIELPLSATSVKADTLEPKGKG